MATTFLRRPSGCVRVTETNSISSPFHVSNIGRGNENVIAVTMDLPGANSTGNNFVDKPSRTVSGKVLEDADNNSSGDDQSPIVYVTFTVLATS